MAEFVGNGFATLDAAENKIAHFSSIPTKIASEFVLKKYSTPVHFTCDDDEHRAWGQKFAIKSIVNIFYNKQKDSADAVRKDVVKGFKKRQRDKSVRR